MNNHYTVSTFPFQFIRAKAFVVVLIALMINYPQPSQANDEVGRIEIHTFKSMTLSDQQFLQGIKDGTPVTLAGELRFPRKKMKHYPVVLLVHGSGGVSGYIDDWAKELNQMGTAVFIMDSFTGRGLYKVNNDQSQLGRLAQIVDAYRALDVLAQHKRIDKTRIVLMGFSRGGQVTLYSGLNRFQQLQGTGSNNEFSAYLAFYPACGTRFKEDEVIANKPIHIFHGSADNYNLVAPCRRYVKRLRDNGSDILLHEFSGAHHVYDYKKLVNPIILKKAQTTRHCVLEEKTDGKIINAQSGRRFTYADPCVELGPTIAFNQNAYNKTKQTLINFFTSHFKHQ